MSPKDVDQVEALKELISLRLDLMQKTSDERMSFVKTAYELNTQEMHRRLELLNNEAGRLKEMQATYLPREVYEANHKELEKIVDGMKEQLIAADAKSKVYTALIAGAISVIVAFGGKVLGSH